MSKEEISGIESIVEDIKDFHFNYEEHKKESTKWLWERNKSIESLKGECENKKLMFKILKKSYPFLYKEEVENALKMADEIDLDSYPILSYLGKDGIERLIETLEVNDIDLTSFLDWYEIDLDKYDASDEIDVAMFLDKINFTMYVDSFNSNHEKISRKTDEIREKLIKYLNIDTRALFDEIGLKSEILLRGIAQSICHKNLISDDNMIEILKEHIIEEYLSDEQIKKMKETDTVKDPFLDIIGSSLDEDDLDEEEDDDDNLLHLLHLEHLE